METLRAPARIAVSDPLPMFHRGIADVMRTVGYDVESPEDLMAWSATIPGPHVVLLTLLRPADWALMAAIHRRRPAVMLIAAVENGDSELAARALRSGAIGVVAREADAEAVQSVLTAAASGQSVLPVDVIRLLASADHPARFGPVASETEISWIRQLTQGLTVARLAEHAGYSERMMFRLLRGLYQRWGVANRTEAMIFARDNGWL
ncbi:DNA-binding response regulator [Micromonospora arida]|uniref:DNA-binding response regulator n=1 Tax=Micromonospora arida TaxID=2203715 RepID=UPI0033FDA468